MTSNRIIVLVDMDCFYVQVEQRRDPEYKGKPCAVVQYKKYRGGGIIAVGYEARSHGVTRGMMGDDAKKKCPAIHLFRVPESNGKANLDRYREAGAEVINVLSQFGGCVERASIDEAYIDLTDVIEKILQHGKENGYLNLEKLPKTHVVGYPKSHVDGENKEEIRRCGVDEWLKSLQDRTRNLLDLRLSIAAVIVEEVRAAVFQQTGFRCSAGISHNKMLSKLSCGINKPDKQTVLPKSSIPALFQTIKIGKVRNLGGKLGKSLMSDFNVEFMSQIVDIDKEKLVSNYGHKTALWLKEVSQGIDYELVKERHVAQSIGCGKNFFGPDALNTKTKVKKWLDALMIELTERLLKDKESNDRIARTLTVHLKLEMGKSFSRSTPLIKYDHSALVDQGLQLVRTFDTVSSDKERWYPAIVQLSVNAKKFDTIGASTARRKSDVASFFQPTLSSSDDSQSHRSHIIEIDDVPVVPKCKFENILRMENSIATSQSTSSKYFVSPEKTKKSINNPMKCDRSEPKASATHTREGFFSKRVISTKSHSLDSLSDVINTSVEQPLECDSSSENAHAVGEDFISIPDCGVSKFDFGNDANENECLCEDVIFVSESSSKPPTQSKLKNSNTDQTLCKIDQMFKKDREKSMKMSQNGTNSVTQRPFLHPNLGEIDEDVFDHLPKDIQQEILKSCEMASHRRPTPPTQNVPTKSHTFSKSKSSNSSQRLISNFVPQNANFRNSSPKIAPKRKSTSPLTQNKTKQNKGKVRNTPSFASKPPPSDAMPLGFFRQRSQLTSAIAKAISNDDRPSFPHISQVNQ